MVVSNCNRSNLRKDVQEDISICVDEEVAIGSFVVYDKHMGSGILKRANPFGELGRSWTRQRRR